MGSRTNLANMGTRESSATAPEYDPRLETSHLTSFFVLSLKAKSSKMYFIMMARFTCKRRVIAFTNLAAPKHQLSIAEANTILPFSTENVQCSASFSSSKRCGVEEPGPA